VRGVGGEVKRVKSTYKVSADGSFVLSFKAVPNESIPEFGFANFNFSNEQTIEVSLSPDELVGFRLHDSCTATK